MTKYKITRIIHSKLCTNNRYNLILLIPSYMITIHKSQGLEDDSVLILLTSEYNINRNLLYTAFTRAEKKLCIIASKEILEYGITTCSERKSLLDYMIKFYDNKKYDDFDDYYCNLIKYKSS